MKLVNKLINFRFFTFHTIFKINITLLLISILSACSDPIKSTEKAAYSHAADIITIHPVNDYKIKRQYIGEINSKQLTNVSFEFGGQVKKLLVDNGDLITQGQLLAELNTELLRNKTNEIKAEITQVNAQLTLNTENLTRLNKLKAEGFISQQSIDERNSEKKILLANLQQLNSALAANTYQISQAKIIAPFSGRVNKRYLNIDEISPPGSFVYQLIKSDDEQINLGVPTKLASKIQMGNILDVIIDDVTVQATVLAIGNQVDPVNRTVNIRLTPTTKFNYFNGQLVKVSIDDVINQQGFWIPTSALTDGIRGQWNIFIALTLKDNTYKMEKYTVNVLYTTDKQSFITGLPNNQHSIIASGLQRLVAGQIVRNVNTHSGTP